ncbi:MAG TPA: hypothetical protein DCE18_06905 [Syntrophobacteraceae bacterium]|nr:hypothetical protein [Syntrophobacteraceae bacterium]
MMALHREMLVPYVFGLYMAIILVAGLWPFDFLPGNGVTMQPGENRLVFNGHGVAVIGNHDLDRLRQDFAVKAVTAELWIKPTVEPTNGVPAILAFHDRQAGKSFFLGQWKTHLIVRTRTNLPTKNNRGYREIGLRDALVPGNERFLTLASDANGTVIYLDGQLAQSHGQYQLFSETGGVDELVVGNSPSGKQGWSGEFWGLAVYNRALQPDEVIESYLGWMDGSRERLWIENTLALYSFRGGSLPAVRNLASAGLDLVVPLVFVPLHRTILACSWDFAQHRWSTVQDVAINVVGFMPFGLLAFLLLSGRGHLSRGRTFVLVTILGLTLSVAIEWAQAYLPSRDSSLIDVVCNGVGTALGAAMVLPPRVRRVFVELVKWQEEASPKQF